MTALGGKTLESQLLNNFYLAFNKYFQQFVFRTAQAQRCAECEHFQARKCPGIARDFGQKYCLSKELFCLSQSSLQGIKAPKSEGSAVQSISNWLARKNPHLPSLAMLRLLSWIFNCSIDALISENVQDRNALMIPDDVFGDYYIMWASDNLKDYNYGLLSIRRESTVRARAYFRIAAIAGEKHIKSLMQDLEHDSLERVYKDCDYCGAALTDNGNIFIYLNYINSNYSDTVNIMIPNVLALQESIIKRESIRTTHHDLLGGVGLCSTFTFATSASTWQKPFSFPFVFSRSYISKDDDCALGIINRIIKSGGAGIDLSRTENFMNYLTTEIDSIS